MERESGRRLCGCLLLCRKFTLVCDHSIPLLRPMPSYSSALRHSKRVSRLHPTRVPVPFLSRAMLLLLSVIRSRILRSERCRVSPPLRRTAATPSAARIVTTAAATI
jgi:hypothetical protein|eukprot:COSAG06_NODE_1308_length_9914_cov_6.225879_7_plen_107_part_00